jgi:hypothetical protein
MSNWEVKKKKKFDATSNQPWKFNQSCPVLDPKCTYLPARLIYSLVTFSKINLAITYCRLILTVNVFGRIALTSTNLNVTYLDNIERQFRCLSRRRKASLCRGSAMRCETFRCRCFGSRDRENNKWASVIGTTKSGQAEKSEGNLR